MSGICVFVLYCLQLLKQNNHVHAAGKSLCTAGLYYRAVGKGIGKWHTYFNNIGPGRFNSKYYLFCRFQNWMPGSKIQRKYPVAFLLEHLFYPVHCIWFTVVLSL
jgi:hypothetical protein